MMNYKQRFGIYVLNYLRFFAKWRLRYHRPIIIGVTGSAGKTSCRKAIASVLRSRGYVKESLHSNSESGLSLNLLDLHPRDYSLLDWLRLCLSAPIQALRRPARYDYYVAEMEADSSQYPKNMSYLISVIQPHIGVYVSAGVAHSAGFDALVKDREPSRHAAKLKAVIAKENGRLLTSLPRRGTAVYYGDDPDIAKQALRCRARQFSVGSRASSTLRVVGTHLTRDGLQVNYRYQGRDYEFATTDLLDPNYAYTFGLALGVGEALGIPLSQGIAALGASLQLPAGRLRVFRGRKQSHIIDSSYNASPKTVASALKLLAKLAIQAPRLAILGDMRELGSLSKSAHQQLAAQIMASCDRCYLFGPLTGEFTLPRLQAKKFPVMHFTQMSELIAAVQSDISRGAWVLVKGSQNAVFLERAVAALLADQSDESRLCRRGSYWDHIRSQTP